MSQPDFVVAIPELVFAAIYYIAKHPEKFDPLTSLVKCQAGFYATGTLVRMQFESGDSVMVGVDINPVENGGIKIDVGNTTHATIKNVHWETTLPKLTTRAIKELLDYCRQRSVRCLVEYIEMTHDGEKITMKTSGAGNCQQHNATVVLTPTEDDFSVRVNLQIAPYEATPQESEEPKSGTQDPCLIPGTSFSFN